MNIPHFKTVGEYRDYQQKLRKASAEQQAIMFRNQGSYLIVESCKSIIAANYREDMAIQQMLTDELNKRR